MLLKWRHAGGCARSLGPTTPTSMPLPAAKKSSKHRSKCPVRMLAASSSVSRTLTNIYVAGLVTTNSCRKLCTPSILICRNHPKSVLSITSINSTAFSSANLRHISNTSGIFYSNPYTAQSATVPPDGNDAFGAIYPTHSTLPASLEPAGKHTGESTAMKSTPTHTPPRNTPDNTLAIHEYLPSLRGRNRRIRLRPPSKNPTPELL